MPDPADQTRGRLTPRGKQVLAVMLQTPHPRWWGVAELSEATGIAPDTVMTALMRLIGHRWAAASLPAGYPNRTFRLTPEGAEAGPAELAAGPSPGTTRPASPTTLDALERTNPGLAAAVREQLGWDSEGRPL